MKNPTRKTSKKTTAPVRPGRSADADGWASFERFLRGPSTEEERKKAEGARDPKRWWSHPVAREERRKLAWRSDPKKKGKSDREAWLKWNHVNLAHVELAKTLPQDSSDRVEIVKDLGEWLFNCIVEFQIVEVEKLVATIAKVRVLGGSYEDFVYPPEQFRWEVIKMKAKLGPDQERAKILDAFLSLWKDASGTEIPFGPGTEREVAQFYAGPLDPDFKNLPTKWKLADAAGVGANEVDRRAFRRRLGQLGLAFLP